MPILNDSAVTYKVYIPPKDYACPITFQNDNFFGLPHLKSILTSTPIGQQLPELALKQKLILGIGHEEPIHTASTQDELDSAFLGTRSD